MRNSQKGFIVPLLIAVIAILAVGGGVYLYKNKTTKSPAVVDTETQQSNQVEQQTTIKTPPVTTKPVASINVLSPSAGERISAGSTFLLKWNSTDTSNRVLITLHLSSGQQIIAPDFGADVTVTNNGSFTWKVPKSFDELNSTPVDRDYVAYITIQDSQNKTIIGRSKDFTIIPSTTTANPSITVLSPNGEEVWKIGSSQKVKFSSFGRIGSSFEITAVKEDTKIEYILKPNYLVAEVKIDGITEVEYIVQPYYLSKDLPEGKYRIKIKVSRTGLPDASDVSDNYFSITK